MRNGGKGHSPCLVSYFPRGMNFSLGCACSRQSRSLIPGLAGGFSSGNELFPSPSEGLERGNGFDGAFGPSFPAGMTLFWREMHCDGEGMRPAAGFGLFEN
jgi:hypothetical protein